MTGSSKCRRSLVGHQQNQRIQPSERGRGSDGSANDPLTARPARRGLLLMLRLMFAEPGVELPLQLSYVLHELHLLGLHDYDTWVHSLVPSSLPRPKVRHLRHQEIKLTPGHVRVISHVTMIHYYG